MTEHAYALRGSSQACSVLKIFAFCKSARPLFLWLSAYPHQSNDVFLQL